MPPVKKVQTQVKLQIEAGKATPAPPVGPALGQAQVNIMEFCKQFNARTQNKEMAGLIIPVVITVYVDRTFTFVTKTPPAAVLLKKAANLAKGSGTPNKDKVGKVTRGPGAGDSQAEDARPEHRHRRVCGEEHQGHRPLHGHRSHGLVKQQVRPLRCAHAELSARCAVGPWRGRTELLHRSGVSTSQQNCHPDRSVVAQWRDLLWNLSFSRRYRGEKL